MVRSAHFVPTNCIKTAAIRNLCFASDTARNGRRVSRWLGQRTYLRSAIAKRLPKLCSDIINDVVNRSCRLPTDDFVDPVN